MANCEFCESEVENRPVGVSVASAEGTSRESFRHFPVDDSGDIEQDAPMIDLSYDCEKVKLLSVSEYGVEFRCPISDEHMHARFKVDSSFSSIDFYNLNASYLDQSF